VKEGGNSMLCWHCQSESIDWTNLECNVCGANESNGYNPADTKVGFCNRCGKEQAVNVDGICNHCFVFGKRD